MLESEEQFFLDIAETIKPSPTIDDEIIIHVKTKIDTSPIEIGK